MNENRGVRCKIDKPIHGGEYVDRTDDAHEKYNFSPMHFNGADEEYCLGFYETKSHNGKDINQMHIEKIVGCESCKNEECVEDVLLPVSERSRKIKWQLPRKSNGWKFGFGRANVWYASEANEELKDYMKKLLYQIENYDGENCIK